MFTYIKPNLVTVERQKYLAFDGEIYPSVTSILSATKSEEFKQALRKWRQKVGTEQAQQITVNACRRGISLHSIIKDFLLEQTLPENIEQNGYWQSIQPVLRQIERVHLVESAVYNSKDKYAGCFDCLGEWNGKLCLFDWKTSSQPKKLEWITDYCLQVTAYIAAINRFYNVNVSQGIIAIALIDRPAQIFYLDTENLLKYWEGFLSRLDLFKRERKLRNNF